MNGKAKWAINGIYKADAELVAQEIESLGENINPEDVLEYAKQPNTELHKCFEWNDTVAAEKYRLEQAGKIIRCLVYVHDTETKEPPQKIRVFYKADEAYVPTKVIVKNEEQYAALLKRAWAELKIFKDKYSTLSELEEIFALID